MSAVEKSTRKVKHEKRRKHTKLISILMVIGVILLIALISIWLFGGGENELEEEQEQSEINQEEEQTDTSTDPESQPVEKEEELVEDQEEKDEIETKEVAPSDDNVIRAYEGNWNPIGTEQEGAHSVNFSEGSQDRIEMRNAILLATGLVETDYQEWWVAGNGEQKVIATVSDSAESEIYRVYLSWVDGQGWQPTKVEELRENDWRKYQ